MAMYLVTGGAGFIGSHLARFLLAQGHQVRVVDNFSTGKRENIADINDRLELIEGDVSDGEVCRRAVSGAEYVLHQAALPSVPRSVSEPLLSDLANARGTLELLVAARDAKVRRFVQACSSSIYGDTPTLPKRESMVPDPRSPYAASKGAGEMYGMAFYHSYGLEYVGLRYFNVFGPRQDPTSQYAAVIPRFITAALERRQPTVYGDGLQSRDFCFIENVVLANMLACTAPQAAGKVVNIACGECIDLLSVLEIIGAELGCRVDPIFEPSRAGDVKHSLADISLAGKFLGYEPAVRFREGLLRTIQWYKNSKP